MRALSAEPGIEVFDIRRAVLAKYRPLDGKTERLQHRFKRVERAAFRRCDRRAA
jgi:hypothetical protein